MTSCWLTMPHRWPNRLSRSRTTQNAGSSSNTTHARRRFSSTCAPSFTGALIWPFMYPWPQRPGGLVEEGWKELAKRWLPILNYADDLGVDLAYELHPGEDLHDGSTFEQFLEATGNHPRVAINYDPSHFVLQCMDYV